MAKEKRVKKAAAIGRDFRTQAELHAMLLPGTICILLFSIIPLFGLLIAFKSFKASMGFTGIFTSQWNNFKNFTQVFRSSQFLPMIKNTLGINLIGQTISILVTIGLLCCSTRSAA